MKYLLFWGLEEQYLTALNLIGRARFRRASLYFEPWWRWKGEAEDGGGDTMFLDVVFLSRKSMTMNTN
jgi:hypothetical protein